MSDLDRTATAVPGDTTARPAALDPRDPAAEPGVPGYRVLDELGRGGMGQVVRAEDARLHREVAVKRLAIRSTGARERFEREAQITARLQHPAIVPIYAAGLDDAGTPFYAMRLVTGATLADAIRATTTLAERLALLRHVAAVADAIAYAHSRRVIHRDLKASNVVVGEFGETVVIDWGLAKDLAAGDEAPLAAASSGDGELTQAGAVIGTPAYMPPEQAEGDPVDERADVYALGVMLYHLLAGDVPYRGGSSAEVLAAVLAGPPAPLTERAPGTPRDLAAIVRKAMARSPMDRYPSARELAAELQRFQTGQLVAAHAYRTRELVARWLRRHRAAVAVAIVALALAVVGGALAIQRVVAARGRAERARDQAEVAQRAAEVLADEAMVARARDLADELPAGALDLLRSLSPGSPAWRPARLVAADATARGIGRLLGRLDSGAEDLATAADGTVRARTRDQLRWDGPGGASWTAKVTSPTLAPDGSAAAWLDGDHAVIDAGAAAPPAGRARVAVPAGTTAISVAPAGAAVFALAAGRMYRIDVASGERQDLGAVPVGPEPVPLSYGCHGAVAAGVAGAVDSEYPVRIRAWTYAGVELAAPDLEMVTVSADHAWAALWSGHRLLLRRIGGGAADAVLAPDVFMPVVRFDPTGRWVAWTQLRDPLIHIRDLASGDDHELRGHTTSVMALAWSRDGRWLASGGVDAAIRLWDVAVVTEPVRPRQLQPGATLVIDAADNVTALAFGDSTELVASTGGGVVARWRLPAHTRLSYQVTGYRGNWLSADLAWSAEVDHGVAVVQPTAGGEPRRLPGAVDAAIELPHLEPVWVAFAADPRTVVVAGRRELVRWNHETGAVERFPIDGAVYAVAIAPAGDQLLAITTDGVAWLAGVGPTRRLTEGVETTVDPVAPRSEFRPLFSPDGRHVAVRAPGIRVFRVADGVDLDVPAGEEAAFARDGGQVAIAGAVLTRCRFEPLVCERLDDAAKAVLPTFGPTGELAAARGALEVVVWRPDSRVGRQVLRMHRLVSALAFAPDGRALVAASRGPELQLVDLDGGESRAIVGIDRDPDALRFESGRLRVAGWPRIYDVPDDLPRDEAGLRRYLDEVLGPDRLLETRR